MPDATFLDSTELVLNMGPQHPSTHGVLRVILKLDGEKILGTDCVIGYLHRGVEKIAENRTWAQFNPYVDRMDYVASVSNGLGYCLAVEKLLNVEAPPRAQVVRVILTELNRIASHLVWLGTRSTSAPSRPCSTASANAKRRSTFSKSTAARGSPRTPSASADCNTKPMTPSSRM
jgi:NADH-quinone oxidoreductase subunit D